MEDLYTKFDREYSDLVRDAKFLLLYLSDSYFGSEDDLVRIRKYYREIIDTKKYFLDRNLISSKEERAWRDDYQDQSSFEKFINEKIDPLEEMFQFIIELYDNNLGKQ